MLIENDGPTEKRFLSKAYKSIESSDLYWHRRASYGNLL